ncbi:MAG TPA: alpha/beta fold hydrolase [Verrucomicrobiae bacterium]|nr:alpha/beta fold hydrolase [Verrucomicrobiae bacterium]
MRLHFREYGRGEPLVILHGLFGSLDNWHFISTRLSEQFRVFALDLRNHGHSPHDDAMNYSAMSEDLLEFLREHSLPEANIMGHSLGGKVAMQFALSNPALVRKLIVADMAPRAYAPAHEAIFNALLALDLKPFQTRQQFDDALAPAIPDFAVRRFLLKSLSRDANGNFRWKFNLAALHKNYPKLNAALELERPFEKPALFIRGEKSNYIRDEDCVLIREFFPRARVETISGASHWLHAEAPEIFLGIVKNFLSAN